MTLSVAFALVLGGASVVAWYLLVVAFIAARRETAALRSDVSKRLDDTFRAAPAAVSPSPSPVAQAPAEASEAEAFPAFLM